MNAQPQLLQIPLDPGDVVYTPDWVARDMVDFFQPTGRILEPCKGDGVFLKYLPPHTEWCEIQEGRDFFKWTEPVDWIIGNPPYKVYHEWLRHSFSVAADVVYLLPTTQIFNSFYMFSDVMKWGGIKNLRVYGPGNRLGFNFGFSTAAAHLQRNYTGPMYTTIYGEDVES